MNREKVLIKNTVIITIGKVCTQMISFFLLPIYTAILSTEEYGVVDLMNTLVSLLLPIITLQIEQALFRFLVDNRNNLEEKKKIISTVLHNIIIQSIIYLIIFIIISPLINNNYKYFLATNVVASVMSSIMLQIARGLGNNKNYAIGSFITAFFTIIFNILFIIVFDFGAYGMLAASLFANIVCVIYLFVANKIYKYFKFNIYEKELLKKLLKYSIPLVPNSLSWWIFNASDRLIVSTILGVGMNGILAAAHKFSGVYITIYNIFNIAWTESASLNINDDDREYFFNNVINTILKCFITMAFCIIVIMPFVFSFFINEKFAEAYNQIPILMIASIFNVILGLLSVIYIAKKDTKTIAKTSVSSAIINIIVHLLLINFIGLYAASISTLIAYLLVSIQRYKDINKRFFKVNLDKKNIVIAIFIGIFICISYYLNMIILNIISVVVVIIYGLFANYKSINTVKKFLLKKIKGEKNEWKNC